ncbi:DUF5011 domain-containing protein [Schleiferilactobacillus harbinensis]|uniref:immunoglobulin-like domain-containing protein n=1 Tax=Schleiferilactobacillus harbinensis TaxID=304207 RepID=UPI0021A2F3BF|nr:immunoglobulin-like domain-containing protein [Schleiferilactobacillus harbinensis]MCT2909660.1 DUF5011 domain-containing protein [Schleiferilactobacillus harbinensis]
MKKNRFRIKYVGAVAAALLAAAPIAATAVSAVSAPAFAATTAKADAQPSRDDLADAVKQGQELIGKLDNDITAAQKDKDDATKAGSDAQAAIPAAEQDLADKKDASGQAAADQVSTVAEQQPIINAAKERQQAAQDLIDAKKPAVDAAQTALNAAKADTATAKKAVDDAYAAVAKINDEIAASKKTQSDLQAQYDAIITERNTHPRGSAEWVALDNQSKPIHGKVNAEIGKQRDLTKLLDPANAAITEAEGTFGDAQAVEQQKQDALDAATTDLNQVTADQQPIIDQAKTDISDAEAKITAAENAHQAATDAVNKAQDALDKLNAAVEQSKTDVTAAEAKLNDLQDQKMKAETDLADAQSALDIFDAKAALTAEVNKATGLVNSGNYTADSTAKLQTAIDAANAVLKNDKATLNQINDAKAAVVAAEGDLVRRPTNPGTPTTPTTYPDPVFSFSDNFVKDPTIATGQSFDQNAGISAWTDSSKSTAIPVGNWQVSSSVDTNKPGTYTVTYTITNNYGKTATLTRTITVSALTESQTSGVVEVTNGSGAALYTDNATSNAAGRTLAKGSAWKIFGVVKDAKGNIVAYNLGGKQYVKASDVAVSTATTEKGTFTVRYAANPKWAIAVYNSGLKVQKLISAGSRWQTFGTKTLSDGKSYFNLGGNQWVRTDYGTWSAK